MQPASYDGDFPPVDFEHDKASHVWKIKSPTIKNPDGSSKQVAVTLIDGGCNEEFAKRYVQCTVI